jgi:hypothetical protein
MQRQYKFGAFGVKLFLPLPGKFLISSCARGRPVNFKNLDLEMRTAQAVNPLAVMLTQMKHLIFIFIFSFSFLLGQTKQKLSGKPATLEETYKYLDAIFDDTSTYNFMRLPEDVAVSRLHFPLGMYIRNNWGLWKGSELKTYFLQKGVYHPEAMSSIIFTSYHRHLLNQPVDLNGQVERYKRINSNVVIDTLANGNVHFSFPELAKEKRTSLQELFEYYPKGDTVLVQLSGKKGIFRKYTPFKGVAIITGYRENKLLLTLIRLRKDDKTKSEYIVGQEIDSWTESCTLIPPKNWKKS